MIVATDLRLNLLLSGASVWSLRADAEAEQLGITNLASAFDRIWISGPRARYRWTSENH